MKAPFYKILISLFLCILASDALSQYKSRRRNTISQNEFRWGPRVGLQHTNMFFKKGDQEYEAKGFLGYNAGCVFEYTIQDVVAVQSGLFYVSAGTKASTIQNRVTYEDKISLNYIRVPFYLMPYFEQYDYTLFTSLGAYIGYAIDGTESIKGDTTYSSKIVFNENSGQLIKSKFDFGLNIGGGIEYNNFQFAVNYNIGLKNITATPNIINNKILMFTVGYMFGQ